MPRKEEYIANPSFAGSRMDTNLASSGAVGGIPRALNIRSAFEKL